MKGEMAGRSRPFLRRARTHSGPWIYKRTYKKSKGGGGNKKGEGEHSTVHEGRGMLQSEQSLITRREVPGGQKSSGEKREKNKTRRVQKKKSSTLNLGKDGEESTATITVSGARDHP